MRPLRVGLDLTSTDRSRLTGWERFVLGLEASLRGLEGHAVHVEGLRFRTPTRSRWGMTSKQVAWNLRGLRRAAIEVRADVVHAPAFPPGPVGAPLVWTIHDDLMVGGHPEYARPGARIWRPLARRALRHVDLVVTGTSSMATDLVARGVSPHVLRVVTPGVHPLPPAGAPPRAHQLHGGAAVGLPSTFALAVGTMEPRKQPHVAMAAAHAAGVPLVWAGRIDPSLDVAALPRDGSTLWTGPIADSQLAWLYAHATCLISASGYEGLDFPLLEARAAGIPVAASDIPVHREMGDAGCIYFPVGDTVMATEAVARALGAPHAKATPPSWEDCARGYLDVYREAAGRDVTAP